MDGEKISLDHQELLEPRLRKLGLNLIDYSFANLYLFREVHAFELLQRGDLYIRGKTRDGVATLMPTRPLNEVDWEDLYACMEGVDALFPIPEEWLPFLDPQQFEWSHVDMDDDYLYQTSKLAHLPGRKLSSRRNLVHQFLEKYPTHELLPLTQERAPDAQRVLDVWQSHPHGDARFTDYEACREALQLIDRLHLSGHLIYVDKEPAAFLLGEKINDKTYVFHFAKGLTEFKGVYQFLFEESALLLEKQCEWINLGQDIGSADIRHSKRSYQPDRLLIKMRVKKNAQAVKKSPVHSDS